MTEQIVSKKEARTEQKKAERAILDQLEILGGKVLAEDDIIFKGEKLVVPERMSLRQLQKFIERKVVEDEEMTHYARVFDYRPWDGAWCMMNALKKTFGAVGHNAKVTQTWFGPMTDPPRLITIQTDVGKNDQVPWGVFVLPFLPGVEFETDQFTHETKGELFYLTARGPKKDRFKIEGVFNVIQEELETNSLYRGKAIDGQGMPEFVDVYSVDKSKVVYSEEVMGQIDANIWTQLRHSAEFERIGIDLKRAVLIHGPFGTGKTLACLLTGQVAIENGWTFIKARPGRDDLSTVLATARLYQPCVVFYEDVDQLVDAENIERMSMTRLLDDFDGIEAKGTKILAVLTTNYPEKIHAGMARPGRIDCFIEISELDVQGVRRLVESRIGDQLDGEVDWDAVFEAAKDYKPAFVTEFAGRTARYLIREHGSVEGQLVGTKELVEAAEGLRDQYNRMIGAKEMPVFDPMEMAVKRVVGETLVESLNPRTLLNAPANHK